MGSNVLIHVDLAGAQFAVPDKLEHAAYSQLFASRNAFIFLAFFAPHAPSEATNSRPDARRGRPAATGAGRNDGLDG